MKSGQAKTRIDKNLTINFNALCMYVGSDVMVWLTFTWLISHGILNQTAIMLPLLWLKNHVSLLKLELLEPIVTNPASSYLFQHIGPFLSSGITCNEALAALANRIHAEAMASLPPNVRRRVRGLRSLQKEFVDIESKFYSEVHALECKYEKMYKPLFEKVRLLFILHSCSI